MRCVSSSKLDFLPAFFWAYFEDKPQSTPWSKKHVLYMPISDKVWRGQRYAKKDLQFKTIKPNSHYWPLLNRVSDLLSIWRFWRIYGLRHFLFKERHLNYYIRWPVHLFKIIKILNLYFERFQIEKIIRFRFLNSISEIHKYPWNQIDLNGNGNARMIWSGNLNESGLQSNSMGTQDSVSWEYDDKIWAHINIISNILHKPKR